ncbi:MAG: T9SS type A sorting domain-containing protein, partial [Chitinophagaceae bacterium]
TGWAYVRNTGSTGGTYSATPAGLSLNAQSGAVSLAQSAAGTYTVSYSPAAGGGCGGAASTTIVVKPQATVNNLPNQVYCSGMVTAPVAFSGTAQSYSWINDNPSIGLAASGTGTSLPSFTTVNAGPGVQYAYIKVTPLGGANTCTGKAAAFRIAVNFCPPVTQAGGTAGDVSSQRSALMQQFQVGPNPARTQVQLTYTGPQEGPFTVQLVSQYGVPVGKLFSFSGTVFTMDLSNTTPGSYLLRVTQVKSGITFDKVVIKL